MCKPLIGISGKGCSGKDTIADYLIFKYGWLRKVSFAAELKNLCADFFDINIECFYDQGTKSNSFDEPVVLDDTKVKKFVRSALGHENIEFSIGTKKISTPRELLQFIGSDVLRRVNSNSLITTILKKNIKSLCGVVIPDVRFPNEASFVLDNGGFLVRVERQKEYVINSGHSSETALDDWTEWSCVLFNFDYGLETFYKKIDKILIPMLLGGHYDRLSNN